MVTIDRAHTLHQGLDRRRHDQIAVNRPIGCAVRAATSATTEIRNQNNSKKKLEF